MAVALQFEKTELRVKLKGMGLTDLQLEELVAQFDQKSRHLDVVTFVTDVERFGIDRPHVHDFLKSLGVDEAALVTVFSRADLRKAGLDENKLQEVMLTE